MTKEQLDLEIESIDLALELMSALIKYKYKNPSDEQLMLTSMENIKTRMSIISPNQSPTDVIKMLEEKFNIAIIKTL